jgi:D-threo-aldose 1-dehydrogenase
VKQTVSAFRHPIPADLWAELKSEKLIRADAPTPA